MPVLDFKEIAAAHLGGAEAESFKLLARECVELVGLRVVEGPDRGADGGRDLVAVEERAGALGTSAIRWLVSCKHKAHSGTAVNEKDEPNLRDRLEKHSCRGFLGFYSTIATSALADAFDHMVKQGYEVQRFDHEMIERLLLSNAAGDPILARYFPVSYESWKSLGTRPSDLLDKYEPLPCKVCGRDLLADRSGIVACVYNADTPRPSGGRHYIATYWACKGDCDRSLRDKWAASRCYTRWMEVGDMVLPEAFLRHVIGMMNELREGTYTYEEDAFEDAKHVLVAAAQMVLRDHSQAEKRRMVVLRSLPPGL